MGFAGEGGREDRLLRRAIPIQVVDDPSGGLSQQEGGVAQGIGQEGLALLRGQVRHESRQGVAFVLGRLSHHGGAGNEPQGIEGHLGAVAVGVGHPKRLEEAVIMFGGRPIAERVGRLFGKQIVSVIAHKGRVPEGVARAVREKEVLLRKRELLGRRIGHLRRVEDPPRGNPPVGVAFAVDIAAVAASIASVTRAP